MMGASAAWWTTTTGYCTDIQVLSQHCSLSLELLPIKCRPFYLPREISVIYMTSVYIQPQANANALLSCRASAILVPQDPSFTALSHRAEWSESSVLYYISQRSTRACCPWRWNTLSQANHQGAAARETFPPRLFAHFQTTNYGWNRTSEIN